MPLKANPDTQAHLLDLQALDTKLQQLDHKAKTLPEIAAIAELTVQKDAGSVRLRTANGALEDSQLELSRIEADVAVVEARIDRDVQRIEASSSVKDVAGLEHELVGLRKRRDDLEEIQLSVMERLEELEAGVRLAAAELEETQQQLAARESERDQSARALTSEGEHVTANRNTITGKLPEDLLALYERQRARYGWGASLLRGGTSLASGVKLNGNDLNDVRAAAPDDVIICPDSQAILVRTAESGL